MHRRTLLTGVATAATVSVAGCTGGSTNDGSDSDQEQKETTVQRNGEQYFFEDERGTLGHLSNEEPPEEAEDWQVVHNALTEDQWEEKQLNDVEWAERMASTMKSPNGEGLDKNIDGIIQRAEEIYVNEEFDFIAPEVINMEQEDDEVTFLRALNKASDEAGVNSSGLANAIVSNIAEHAVNESDVVDFNDYKVSTLPATEEASGRGGHAGGSINGKGNSGFRHMPAVLQYVKDGEAELKYAEMTTPGFAPILGEDAIREPENSMYREELGQGRLKNGNYPLHFVAATDYTKARKLESREEDILGLEAGEENPGSKRSIGDYIGSFLHQLVDDVHVTGYSHGGGNDINPDVSRKSGTLVGYTLVSDDFGKALEDAIVDPTIETRQYMENIGRGLYKIREEQGWDTSVALTVDPDSEGLEGVEIRGTTDKVVEEIRANLAYGEVRARIAA
ncbi:MAG: hypothetical protein ABEH60_00805 [Halonotius sp.]